MKRLTLPLSAIAVLAIAPLSNADPTEGMKLGDPGMKSIGSLAFGQEGILFAADPKGAAVFAIDTEDTDQVDTKGGFNVAGIDKKVAGLLGTTADEILIQDLAVNPASGCVYLSVSRGKGADGKPALVRIEPGGEIGLYNLAAVKHSKLALTDAPDDAVTGEGRRRKNKRLESITDLAYTEDGQVAIAGLSNEEFASTLRRAHFPFEKGAVASGVEIYHGAHGKLETHSPIRTFLPMNIGGDPHIVASYTCTPLVTIPLKELKPKAKIVGKTVAELGNRNRPLDMIEYQSGDKTYILIANSARGIMKVSTENITTVDPISKRTGVAGLSYDTIEDWKGITQLGKLGDKHAMVIRADDSGQHLEQRKLP